MTKRMLIDAAHPEETRVVVVNEGRIEDFDYESSTKARNKGNIYLAKITRIEPSLQAAFVDYGGNRHGFLAFNEIHPDYYQIPIADREALIEAEAEVQRAIEARERSEFGENGDPVDEADTEGVAPAEVKEEEIEPTAEDHIDLSIDEAEAQSSADDNGDPEPEPEDQELDLEPENTDDSSALEENDADLIADLRRMRRQKLRSYKIQEVIKRRQIILVQVVKEERGNKGAALTTYLSLAGRYGVLMPNTARGGGISRKINSPNDRKRLRTIVEALEVPKGMGLIVRTAGAKRTKIEIKRDYEYLLRLWENVRSLTLESMAPSLVYEEGSLVKRAIRDLYSKDIESVFVEGEEAYREAKEFMRTLTPSHAKNIKQHKDTLSIFQRYQVESQLDAMLLPQVQLKSGGYLVINPTEALVAIDVNSGKATRERSIERTALQTNLEAAEEAARQCRLRDLAGLLVIDFIDMEEHRNNRAVEKRLKECLKKDRARIQVGRISTFGLLEMSRQRMRSGVLEGTTTPCTVCTGTGMIRALSSTALRILRTVEDMATKGNISQIIVRVPVATGFYLLNEKRSLIQKIEDHCQIQIVVNADESLVADQYEISKGTRKEEETNKLSAIVTPSSTYVAVEEDDSDKLDDRSEPGENKARRRKRRRGRKPDTVEASASDADAKEGAEEIAETPQEGNGETRRRRRRGKRGGRRHSKRSSDQEQIPEQTIEQTVEQADTRTPESEAPQEAPQEAPMLEQPMVESARPHNGSGLEPQEATENDPSSFSEPKPESEVTHNAIRGEAPEPPTSEPEPSPKVDTFLPPMDTPSHMANREAEDQAAAKPKEVKRGWWRR